MSCARGLDQVFGESFVLRRLVVQRSHLIHVELVKTLVQGINTIGVLLLVDGCLHDSVGHFHISKRVQHRCLLAEYIIVVD